jgi:predicted metal-dependent hydrolase
MNQGPMDAGGGGVELPRYTVRVSTRARRVVLSIRPRQGLEVVLPRGVDPALAPDFVRGRLDWVRRHLARLDESEAQGPAAPLARPEVLHFQALDRTIPLTWVARPLRGVRLTENAGRLSLSGRVRDPAVWRPALLGYLRRAASAELPAMLAALAGRTGLAYEAARVRLQRSRWGSCSAGKVINLNAKLLFLPRGLAEHVLLHELCHTRHHHHRATFWRLVERVSPDWREREAELRQAWRHVPAWVEWDGGEAQDPQ